MKIDWPINIVRVFVGLVVAACGAGCAPEEKPPFCPLVKQPTETAAFDITFVNRGTAPAVIAAGYEGTACYMLEADGRLGERFCHVRYWDQDPDNPLPFAYMRGSVLLENSIARYSSRYVARADFDADHAAVSLLSFEVGEGDAQLTHLFEQPEGLYGIWTRKNVDGTTSAGLAQIGADDVVRAVGVPFFNGIPFDNVGEGGVGIGYLDGVFDAENDRFLIDSPDGITLVELDRQGNVLASTPHGQTTTTNGSTHLVDWTKLPTGEWVGLNGGWLCQFDPRDRTTETCFQMQIGLDVAYGTAEPIELNVDAKGDLWSWIRVNPAKLSLGNGASLARYDGKESFNGKFTPLSLDICDWIATAQ